MEAKVQIHHQTKDTELSTTCVTHVDTIVTSQCVSVKL